MILFWHKCVQKIKREYRSALFRKTTGTKSKKLKIRGEIFVMNKNIKIGENVSIYPGVQFFGDGLIEIGDNVSIGNGTLIYASKEAGVKIGNDTMIAAQCYIIDSDHGIHKDELMRSQKLITEKAVIENDVWIAANCTVLRGSIVHEGAVIGAKSLVRGEIDPYAVAVGIPAKIKKYRR